MENCCSRSGPQNTEGYIPFCNLWCFLLLLIFLKPQIQKAWSPWTLHWYPQLSLHFEIGSGVAPPSEIILIINICSCQAYPPLIIVQVWFIDKFYFPQWNVFSISIPNRQVLYTIFSLDKILECKKKTFHLNCLLQRVCKVLILRDVSQHLWLILHSPILSHSITMIFSVSKWLILKKKMKVLASRVCKIVLYFNFYKVQSM